MSRYIDRLQEHPGIAPAAMISLLFLAAGAGGKDGLIAGSIASLVVWSIVLLTALPDHDKQSGGNHA